MPHLVSEIPAPRHDLISHVLRRVAGIRNDAGLPAQNQGTVSYMIDRWSNPECFQKLDEISAATVFDEGLSSKAINVHGQHVGHPHIIDCEIEWASADTVKITITYIAAENGSAAAITQVSHSSATSIDPHS